MDIFKQGMKGPTRPAPAVPGFTVNRYSPVTNWNDDPFGADVFEPTPQYTQKKMPPPRPPPPKVNKQPDIPTKPSHFMRRPTVLSSLLSRKNKTAVPNPPSVNTPSLLKDTTSDVDTHRMFPKCEPKIVQTGALIDFSSPPSSPTFTTRSSSDGLSVDSFGSDATTSTNHHNAINGGSTSQAESGFEDDFDLFLHSRKAISKEDTFDDFAAVDPFSPQSASNKPPLLKKPVMNRDLYDVTSNGKSSSTIQLKGPTIIRAKPARPKPPDNAAILKSTFGNTMPVTLMNVNTTTPIQKVSSFGESFDDPKPFSWEHEESLDRESSPPMPSIPPPPPPPLEFFEDIPVAWPQDLEEPAFAPPAPGFNLPTLEDEEEPYAIALFDYHTGHPDDLSFSANNRITLIRKETDEWFFGKLRNGSQGLFPANYVEIKVPLPNEHMPSTPHIGTATALYDFEPAQTGDLRFMCGDTIKVTHKLNEEWYFGECNGVKGQFPINYVEMKF